MKYILTLLLVVVILLNAADTAFSYKTVQFKSEFGGKGEDLGKFSYKTRFAFDKDGNIYVVDTENLNVQKLSPEGKPIMKIEPGDDFLFSRPMDIAVDGNMNIYVVDWGAVYIEGTDSPGVFNYGPCVHKFSPDGDFMATFTLEDLSQKVGQIEQAVPAVDTDGSFALMILPQETDRHLYICADADGNIYALDQDTIYKLSDSGKILASFGETGGGAGQLDSPTDITVDAEGNVCVADAGNNRISKFSPTGDFLLSFGERGETDGHFKGELRIAAASDGTMLVADSARFEKVFKTGIEHRKLIDSSILVTGQDDPLIPRRRNFRTVISRVQRFDSDGEFQEKILYRIDRSDPESRDLKFKTVDPDGNIYLLDSDRLTVSIYSIENPVQWSEVEKTLSCRVQLSGFPKESRSQIDNFYDLDSYIDFDEKERYTQITATMRLSYDMTETFRISLDNSLTRLDAVTYADYPGERALGGFIQDDETIDDYYAFQTRLDLKIILDHDPFNYRVGNFFAYFGGGRYDFRVRATDFQNRRRLEEELWWASWAAGARYDIGSSARLSLIAVQHYPPGFMNYKYKFWDENGELYGTGSGEGSSTEVYLSIDGAF